MTVADRRAAMARMWTESEWPEVARFIGPNAESFRRTWETTRSKVLRTGSGLSWHFCWPALFIGFAWFFYRRMWAVGGLLLVLPIIAGYFLPGAGTLGALVGVAAMGKSLYVQHTVGRIDKIKAAGGGYDAMEQAGGISVAGAVVGAVIIALSLLAVIVSMFDFRG